MRRHLALLGLALALSIIIGTVIVTANMGNTVEVDVWIWPQFLTVEGFDHYHSHSSSEWVIAFIQLPRDYNTRDVDMASITLQVSGGSVPVSHYYAIWGRIIAAKFDRTEVVDLIRTSIGHITPQPMHKVTLVVTGDLQDGNVFRGQDTITVFFVDE